MIVFIKKRIITFQKGGKFCLLLCYLIIGLNTSLWSQVDRLISNNEQDSSISKIESIDTLKKERRFSILERQSIHLMVVPNFSDYQKIKKENRNYKVVLNAISKSLEEYGFVVKDFAESLKISEAKYQTQKSPYMDPFKVLLENAPADIFIYVDLYLETDKNEKQVSISLVAKDKYTADRYVSSPYLSSTKRRHNNFQTLALEALSLNHGLDSFIFQLEEQLLHQVEYGRKIDLKIESKNPDNISLNQAVDSNKTLNALFLNWIHQRSISYYIPGQDKGMLRAEINIPFFNQYDRIYTPSKFGLDFQRFIKKTLLANDISSTEVELRVIGRRVELLLL